MSGRTSATNPRPPQTDFAELVGTWTLTMSVDVHGKVRASLGRLDLSTRRMRWTTVGERQCGSESAPVPPAALATAADIVMLDAAAQLRLG